MHLTHVPTYYIFIDSFKLLYLPLPTSMLSAHPGKYKCSNLYNIDIADVS